MTRLSCRAFDHASEAAGMRWLRPGFCFREEDDVAFALGFPHLRYLDPESLDDLAPEANAERCLLEPGTELECVFAPRTAALLARGWLLPEPTTPYPDELELTDAARAALATSPSLDAPDARARIRDALQAPTVATTAAEALLLCEAWLGTAEVVDAVISAVETLPDREETWVEPGRARALSMTALMALRLPAGRASVCRAALEAPLEKLPPETRLGAGLSWSGPRASVPVDAPAVEPTPARVRAALRASPGPFGAVPDPRLAFIGGGTSLARLVGPWRQYAALGTDLTHGLIAARHAPIRRPEVVVLMLGLWRRGAVPEVALAWLELHGAFVEPVARRLASGSGVAADDAVRFLARPR